MSLSRVRTQACRGPSSPQGCSLRQEMVSHGKTSASRTGPWLGCPDRVPPSLQSPPAFPDLGKRQKAASWCQVGFQPTPPVPCPRPYRNPVFPSNGVRKSPPCKGWFTERALHVSLGDVLLFSDQKERGPLKPHFSQGQTRPVQGRRPLALGWAGREPWFFRRRSGRSQPAPWVLAPRPSGTRTPAPSSSVFHSQPALGVRQSDVDREMSLTERWENDDTF